MKHLHFIGICGVGMGALAILFKEKGWVVTGSDVGFYPPVSTNLEKHGVVFYPGWHPEKVLKNFEKNSSEEYLVVVGNVAGSENPEWKYVEDNNLLYVSYPELIARYLVKENSIVCAGTYGKTSSTTLLAWILKESGYNPAYMFGGISKNLDLSADNPSNSEWSILEGDEYKTARWDNRPKFFSYSPTHLLLTAVEWDHADIYKTEADYTKVFDELINLLPKSGLIVACLDNANVNKLIKETPPTARVVSYGRSAQADYCYLNIQQNKAGLSLDIVHQSELYRLNIPVIGEYMAENVCGAFALANEIGVPSEKIISALAKFTGLKRRLEKRGTLNGADVFDDIAHSPVKAKSALNALKKIYTGNIYAIFEPNTGNREKKSAPFYDQAFSDATEVIIPRLTKLKNKEDDTSLEGDELASIIKKNHANVLYIPEDTELVTHLKNKTQPNDVVVFLGSHGFRGMIEELVK